MNWHDYFTYDTETGNLVWKPREGTPKKVVLFNKRDAGNVAGSNGSKKGGGFRGVVIGLHGKDHYAHRIVWEMHYGPIPKDKRIDHRDTNPLNNRLDNLRLCTHSQNMHNASKAKRNTSGVKGVTYDKSRGLWSCEVRCGGVRHRLGRYPTKGLAAVVRAKAALRLHGEFVRFN
jgi:hypothetical protein